MDKKCDKEDETLTLQDMLRIALGRSGKFTQTNIAILYSVVNSILKKLNCENEVVSIAGLKTDQLLELLQKANHCPLSCDWHLKVLTEKLDKLEELERQVDLIEAKLNKHLDMKFPKVSSQEMLSEEEVSKQAQDFPPTLQLVKVAYRKPQTGERRASSLGISFGENVLQWRLAHNSSELPTIKSSASRWDFHRLPVTSTMSADVESENISLNADCLINKVKELKESFSAFKRRVEDGDGWWEIPPSKCEQTSSVNSSKESQTMQATEVKEEAQAETETGPGTQQAESSVATQDAYCCYVPCEDVFTIPSPENEIPRALLHSGTFMKGIENAVKAPFMRRYRKMDQNLKILVSNLQNWLEEVREGTSDISSYDNVFAKIAEIGYIITSNNYVVGDTLEGMQEIFDLKFDKIDIIPVKEEFAELLTQSMEDASILKKQFSQSKTASFVYQTEAEKRESEALRKHKPKLKKCTARENEVCDGNGRESQLLWRIEQISWLDMNYLKDRQAQSYKLLRLTNNSGVLKEISKTFGKSYKNDKRASSSKSPYISFSE